MALNFFSQGRDEIGAICFVGSLVFKQMSLYYAPAIGAYLLGRCISLGRTKGCDHVFILSDERLLTR